MDFGIGRYVCMLCVVLGVCVACMPPPVRGSARNKTQVSPPPLVKLDRTVEHASLETINGLPVVSSLGMVVDVSPMTMEEVEATDQRRIWVDASSCEQKGARSVVIMGLARDTTWFIFQQLMDEVLLHQLVSCAEPAMVPSQLLYGLKNLGRDRWTCPWIDRWDSVQLSGLWGPLSGPITIQRWRVFSRLGWTMWIFEAGPASRLSQPRLWSDVSFVNACAVPVVARNPTKGGPSYSGTSKREHPMAEWLRCILSNATMPRGI